MTPLRIGIIGASRAAVLTVMTPIAARSDALVVAIADLDQARARSFAQKHGVADVALDGAALIDRDDLDLIYVGTPIASHAAWSIQALKANKAVFCEKAFARSAVEAQAMVDASRSAKLPLLEAFHYRFTEKITRAKTIVQSGELGRLTWAEATVEGWAPDDATEIRWREDEGGGALADHGCYAAHMLRTLVGLEPQVLCASMMMRRGVDAATQADLQFSEGFEARMTCSILSRRPEASLTIRGDRGRLTMRNVLGQGGAFHLRAGGVLRTESSEGTSGYEAQFDHVISVLRGETTPLTGGRDAVDNLRLLDAIRRRAQRTEL